MFYYVSIAAGRSFWRINLVIFERICLRESYDYDNDYGYGYYYADDEVISFSLLSDIFSSFFSSSLNNSAKN